MCRCNIIMLQSSHNFFFLSLKKRKKNRGKKEKAIQEGECPVLKMRFIYLGYRQGDSVLHISSYTVMCYFMLSSCVLTQCVGEHRYIFQASWIQVSSGSEKAKKPCLLTKSLACTVTSFSGQSLVYVVRASMFVEQLICIPFRHPHMRNLQHEAQGRCLQEVLRQRNKLSSATLPFKRRLKKIG